MGSLRNFTPEEIYESTDSSVFITLMEKIFDDIKFLIDRFPELADVDNVSDIFLPKLAELIKYQYNYEIDTDVQREIIKRMIETYRRRGTDDSIIMAATYGNDPNWIADHLFLPGAEKDREKATLEYPTDMLFRHSISKFSSTHKYANSTMWRDGVLIINVSYLDDEIRKAIMKVVPGGVKIYFNIQNNSCGDGEYGELVYGEWKLLEDYEIDYQIIIKDRTEVAVFDERGIGRRLRSGRQKIFTAYELFYPLGVSMLSIEDSSTYVNKYLGQVLPNDLIRTETRTGQVIYKKLKNVTSKDYFRINKGLTTNIVFNDPSEYEQTVVMTRDYLMDRSRGGSFSSSKSKFSGRDINTITEQELPRATIDEIAMVEFESIFGLELNEISSASTYDIILGFEEVFGRLERTHQSNTEYDLFLYFGALFEVQFNLNKPVLKYPELFKTSMDKGSSRILKFFELMLGDAVYVDNTQVEGKIINSMIQHDINYRIPGVDIKKKHDGIPKRSHTRAIRSGKYALSGTYTGIIFMSAPIEDVLPQDRWYPVNSIYGLKPSRYNRRYEDASHVSDTSKIYEGIKDVAFAKINHCYVETTDGIQLISEITSSVIVYNSYNRISEILKFSELKLNHLVKCYSRDTYLRNYATDTDIITEVFTGNKSLREVTLNTLVQTEYDTELIGFTKNPIKVGSSSANLMELKLNQVLETYSNKQIKEGR